MKNLLQKLNAIGETPIKVLIETVKGQKGTKLFENRSMAIGWINSNATKISNYKLFEDELPQVPENKPTFDWSKPVRRISDKLAVTHATKNGNNVSVTFEDQTTKNYTLDGQMEEIHGEENDDLEECPAYSGFND